MFEIPASFKNNNNDYITLPVIKRFIKNLNQQGEKIPISLPRETLMERIETYANKSVENKEKVLQWIDDCICEGIKDIYLNYGELSPEIEILFSSEQKAKQYINHKIAPTAKRHVCQNSYNSEFNLVNATYESTNKRKLKFIYCKKLYMLNDTTNSAIAIDYPVIAEYYLDSSFLLIRAKPKANLYEYYEGDFSQEKADKTSSPKQADLVKKLIIDLLHIQNSNVNVISSKLKNKIFLLLDKLSSTPKEIQDIMTKNEDLVLDTTEKIRKICNAPITNETDIKADLSNIIEKYLSINWKDKDIFIKDREAYPLSLAATDEEDSKVEQKAGADEPLQTKAIFFDNKKMIYKNKGCDGVTFKWQRINPLEFSDKYFKVKIRADKMGHCTFKFMEYTPEEDIENVIFSIIEGNENIDSTSTYECG